MTKGIKIDHKNHTITLTKVFAKKAETYGTPEYKDLMAVLSTPITGEYKVATRTIKKNPDKETYKNLTYQNMETYINTTDTPEAYMAEFEVIKMRSKVQKAPYKFVVKWFITKFPNYKEADIFVEDSKPALLTSNVMSENSRLTA